MRMVQVALQRHLQARQPYCLINNDLCTIIFIFQVPTLQLISIGEIPLQMYTRRFVLN